MSRPRTRGLHVLLALVGCSEASPSDPVEPPPPTCLDADVPVSDVPDFPLAYQTEHLDIYVDPERFLCAGSALDYDRHVQYVADQLEIDIQRRIPVYVTEDVGEWCPPGAAGCAKHDGTVLASSGTPYHELTHGVACEIRTHAASILAEGLAVAFEPATESFSANPPEFAELSTTDGFPYYSEAGHFVRWLLTQISPAEFRELYRTATYSNGVWDTMVDLYGPTLEQDYADTKPYAWVEHRQCADMPFLPEEPGGGWRIDITLDCEDESTYGPYERTFSQLANGSLDMVQSFLIYVPAPGVYVVTGAPYPDAVMRVERCLPEDSYPTKAIYEAENVDTSVWLNFQSVGHFEFHYAGLHRIDVRHKHGPPVDVWFTFTPDTMP